MTHLPKILLVDDDPNYLKLFKEKNRDWFAIDTRDEAVSLFRDMSDCRKYQALIVDLHMPGIDGLNLCYKAKQNLGARFPIFILSQDQDEKSKLLGLKLKVDDYLTKNMSWEEIALRIRNRITRLHLEHEGLIADEENLEIEILGQRTSVTRVELGILTAVIAYRDSQLTRQALMSHVWSGRSVVAHTLNSHLHNLNSKIKNWGRQIRIDRDGIVSLHTDPNFKNDSLNKDPSSVGK